MADFLYNFKSLESRKTRKGRIFRDIHPPHFLNGVQEVAGSNPVAPTHLCERNALRLASKRPGRFTKTTRSRGGVQGPLPGCLAAAPTVSTNHVALGRRRATC